MNNEFNDIKSVLKKYNQEHILSFYNELSDAQKENLFKQIQNTNFEKINSLYNNSKTDKSININDISLIEYIDKEELNTKQKELYEKIGIEAIIKNQLAIVTLAGGQGSRLGVRGIKGSYELDINGGIKSLFEINFNNIKNIKEKYNVSPFWLIMTSQDNDLKTKEFFEKKKYFNYDKDKTIFFKQGMEPIIDINGKIVLENKHTIKKASNGNGDVFRAMYENSIILRLKENKVKYICFGGIDNILAKPIDPIFLGLMINNNYKIGSKSVFKEEALEKEAVFCKINDKPSILGYNHITNEISNLKNKNGKYLYRDKNILSHLMSMEAVEKVVKLELEYHRVYRKNTYLDINSKEEKYIEENSFKFEKFIFDSFKNFDKMLLLRVDRKKEFAPIKSLEGDKGAIEAIKLYNNYLNNRRRINEISSTKS